MDHRPTCKRQNYKVIKNNIKNYITLSMAMLFQICNTKVMFMRNKMNIIKIKNFCFVKDNVKRMRRGPTE